MQGINVINVDFPDFCLCHLQLDGSNICADASERDGGETVAAILPQGKHVANTDAPGFHNR